MCDRCYAEYGSPREINEQVLACVKLIEGVYFHHGCGGHLHSIVDDWNLEDQDFRCETLDDWWKEIGLAMDTDNPERLRVERECYLALKALTLPERAAALAIYDGFLAIT